VIQLKGDFTETAPSNTGFVLKYASGVPVSDATKTVTIRKMGSAGNHPLLKAWSNTSGTLTAGSTSTGDGIFKLVGTDYITIEHVDLSENELNTAAGPRMEYGYALLKESVTNGTQHCTITGCKITLSRLNNTSSASTGNEAGSTGIAVLNITNTSSSNLNTSGASAAGANSYNVFSGNTITDVFNGIVVKGFNAGSPYTLFDQGNRIGVTGNGNTITNYGGSGTAAAMAFSCSITVQTLCYTTP
jgi:hypothetical protein